MDVVVLAIGVVMMVIVEVVLAVVTVKVEAMALPAVFEVVVILNHSWYRRI